MRFFNTAGPCDAAYHYMLPAAERLPEAPGLVHRGGYFVVHAPRQTGKTTTLRALAHDLTAAGEYAAVHVSCEIARSIPGADYPAAQRAILDAIWHEAELALPAALQPPTEWPARDEARLLTGGLRAWTQGCPRRVVLFLDEIDVLTGASLLNVLSQLRASYPSRPRAAPWSVILCGMRDVRDYKARSGGDPTRLGSSSPFNIKIKSLRLGDFSADEVATVYGQHSADTGQPFTAEAVQRAFALSQGQPWLVNALAREIIDEMGIVPPEPITGQHVEQAKERLILARATHLDSLAERLTEPRVQRIIEPLMAGGTVSSSTYDDDASYAHDLGLIVRKPHVGIANPIYREVIARVLAAAVEGDLRVQAARFVKRADGCLDMAEIMAAFCDFWREHGEILTGTMTYHEVAPQLVLMAFLQNIVNGNGFIDREYGVGRGRIDLLVRWPYTEADGRKTWQREALELKVWRDKKPDPLAAGLGQLDGYLDELALDTGILVLFDRRTAAAPLGERISLGHTRSPGGRQITLLRA